jgi:hypothetical protein
VTSVFCLFLFLSFFFLLVFAFIREIVTFLFIDRYTHYILFLYFYPYQLVDEPVEEDEEGTEENNHQETAKQGKEEAASQGNYEIDNDYLLRYMLSYLQSFDYYDKALEKNFESNETFYKIMIGMTLSPISLNAQEKVGAATNSYLLQLVRYSGNDNYIFNFIGKQVNSQMFFDYFIYQLKKLLKST